MIRGVRIILLAAVVLGLTVTLRSTLYQQSPNATRAVIGARQIWCSDDGRFTRTGFTGWLPTERCTYPVALPRVHP